LSEGNRTYGLIAVGTNATLWLAQSTVTGNATGYISDGGAVINTYGDNYFAANGNPIGSSLTSISKQ
jgi:hypothetical protein